MWRYICLLLVVSSMLLATNSEPLFLELGTGLKKDSLSWELLTNNDANKFLAKEHYRGLNYLQTQGTMRMIHRDIYLLFQGTWATFGRGAVVQTLPFNNIPVLLTYKTRGNDYSIFGVLGYQVNLTEGRYYKVFLTPLFGYAGYWKRISKMMGKTSIATSGDYVFEEDLEHNQMHDTWYGPIIGGDLLIEPGGRVNCNFYYMFNWLKLNHSDYMGYKVTNAVLGIDEIMVKKTIAKCVRDRGQYGGVKLFFSATSYLNVNVEMQFRYFSSYKYKVKTFTYDTVVAPIPTTTVTEQEDKMVHWWWSFVTLLEMAYLF